MSAIEYILDGLEAALELERELGVRVVEIDRGLLAGEKTADLPTKVELKAEAVKRHSSDFAAHSDLRSVDVSDNQTILPLVFLHDRPLSPGGIEMMAKIIGAMKRTAENTPIVVAPPLPKARIVVVLGGRALKLHFPQLKGGPGQWTKLSDGTEVLITYSPEYILRFGTVTSAVKKLKQDMWTSLKAVIQRLAR